eukprot:gene10361-8300_t
MSAYGGAVLAGSAVALLQSAGAAGLSAGATAATSIADTVREWELFHVEILEGSEKACIRSTHGKFLSAEQNGGIIANHDEALDSEMFEIHWQISVDAGGLREDQLMFVGAAAFKTHHEVFVTVFPSGLIRGQAREISPGELVSVYYVESLRCFALKSHLGQWLCATPGGPLEFRDKVREWELFHVEIPEGSEKACIRSNHGKFLCAEQDGCIVANRDKALDFEMFEIHWQSSRHF